MGVDSRAHVSPGPALKNPNWQAWHSPLTISNPAWHKQLGLPVEVVHCAVSVYTQNGMTGHAAVVMVTRVTQSNARMWTHSEAVFM